MCLTLSLTIADFSLSLLPSLLSPPLTQSLSPLCRMMWRMRRRSRTICLSLALISIFLHLLLALVSLSSYHQPCDPPPPLRTQFLRDLARTNYTSTDVGSPAELPAHTTQRDSHIGLNASKGAEVHTQALPDLSVNGAENADTLAAAVERDEALVSTLSKLEALFDHPLYNLPSPPIPEEDWLLKVKPKLKASEKSSQMWSVLCTTNHALSKPFPN